MSFTFAHQKTVQGGGVPLPDGNVYDTSAYSSPMSFSIVPCTGTGFPAATYPKTVYVRSENALFYDYNINGGAFTPSTPVPGGPPITGNFDWNFTIPLPTNAQSMQNNTNLAITLRLRPVADVTAVAKIINFTLVIARCARPVNASGGFSAGTNRIFSCSNSGPTSTGWRWSTGIVANAAGFTIVTPSGTFTLDNGFAPGFTSANAGQTFSINIPSISGVVGDGFLLTDTIVNAGEFWCDPCGGQCYTSGCFNRFENCDCPSPGSCVTAGTCVPFDCRGTPAGCGGNFVTDCRGMCVDPGSAFVTCDCPSPGSCVAPGSCQVRDCAGTCGGSFVPCDCPSPGSCVASCQTRDCNGVCGGSAVQDCAGTCGGTAVDCGCGCGMPCVSCPGGGVSCGGAPCPAPPPSCSASVGGNFTCCGCMTGDPACDNFLVAVSCSGDPSQNCNICVTTNAGTSCGPGSSFSATGGCQSLWGTCANCDGGNPTVSQAITITCDNGSASGDNNC